LSYPTKSAPKSKTEFYERYLKGDFGNRPRSWATWADLLADGYNGRVTLRDMAPGGPCYYGIEVEDLKKGILPSGCATLSDKRFNEGMPDEFLTIQGNVWYDLGLKLEYSCVPGIGHRDAVRQPNMRQAEGLMASSLLKTYLDPNSHDDLRELLDLYPEAVIEFSTYSKPVGVLPNRSTVFWEVRNY
jgi:hypothetical protein